MTALVLSGREYDIINFMQIIIKFIKNNWPILIVLVVGILASRTLLFQKGYFNMHDDLQMMRQLEMEKCFKDGQIPCRWVPDMGYKYGFPLFNFYPPLPYLVGQVIRTFGFAFTDTAKILFALSLIFSGLSMYVLVKEIFKSVGKPFDSWAGIISASFYIWAPYHSVDVYVRGAMNESWALIFFPLIFYFGYKLIIEKQNLNKWMIGLSLSYFGLFTSHNLMIMIFTPIFLLWSLIWLKQSKSWSRIFQLGLSGLFSLGLSAFFTLPAVFENNLTWLKSQLIGYYDYTAHFVSLSQLLISKFWGYGPSVWLEYDGMPFPAGHVHWILSLIIMALWLFSFWINRKKKKKLFSGVYLLIPFLFLIGWFAAFMTHVRSTPIYQALPFLALVQFPWRFLTLVTFAFSLLAGSVVLKTKNKIVYIFLILSVIIFNWNFFLPQGGKMGNLTDDEKFSGEAWQLQLTAGIYDYLPVTAKMAPRAPQKVLAEFMEGTGSINDESQGTDWAKFNINVETENSKVRINIFEFPNWIIKIDGHEVGEFVPEEEVWGRMWIEVPKGEHKIEAKFTNTPIRTVSNYVSLISWLGLIVYLMLQFKSGTGIRNNSRIGKTKIS